MQPMLGLSRRLLVQDETDLTKTLKKGWDTLFEGGEEKTREALQIFSEASTDYPEDPRAHNYCGIANEILGEKSKAKENYEKADGCAEKHTGNDYVKSPEALQNLRKWKPIGWEKRGDPEGKTKAEGTDFLISFQTEDSEFNNNALKKLSESSVIYRQIKEEKKGH